MTLSSYLLLHFRINGVIRINRDVDRLIRRDIEITNSILIYMVIILVQYIVVNKVIWINTI